MSDPVKLNEPASAIDLRRRQLLYVGVAATAGVAGGALAWWKYAVSGASSRVDAALWQRSFPTPGGSTLELVGFQKKPLVLNFWATWCPPCVAEMPLLDRFYRENMHKGWQVVGLAIDKAEPVRRFVRENAIGFPVGLAENDGYELVQTLGNLSGGLPFTVLIGEDGSVIQRKMGRLLPADLSAWAQLKSAP